MRVGPSYLCKLQHDLAGECGIDLVSELACVGFRTTRSHAGVTKSPLWTLHLCRSLGVLGQVLAATIMRPAG